MSLSRLALRLAAVETLAPFAAQPDGPFPTLAGREVYDTRVDPLDQPEGWDDFLARVDGKPLIIVYAEEQETRPWPETDFNARVEIVDLVVELMIAARAEIDAQAADGSMTSVGALASPASDREREALLDMLEAQVRRLLDVEQPRVVPPLFLQVAMECRHIHSVPQRGVERTQRVAARTLKMRFKVKRTDWPLVAPAVAPTGLDVFPEPLATVANALDPASSGGLLCAALAGMIPSADAATAPDIRIGVGVFDDAGDIVSADPTSASEGDPPANVVADAPPDTV